MGLAAWVLVPVISLVVPLILLTLSSPYKGMVNFVAYDPPPKIELEGVLAFNDKLTSIRRIGEGKLKGPETITFDEEGNIYTGTEEGNIMRVSAKDESVEIYAYVGGRPLALAFDKNRNLIVCDALKGLLSVHPITRQTTILASHVGDSPIAYADGLAIAKSGKIYFTDATNIAPVYKNSHWDPLGSSVVAFLSNEPTGRLLEYDPETRKTRILLGGMVFANGLALSKDEDFIYIAETGRPSIHRFYLTGRREGGSNYFVENLPGYPDGVTLGSDGRIYVSIFGMRTPLEALHPFPAVKEVLVSLLPVINVIPKPIGCVVVLDKDGNFVETLWDPKGERTFGVTHVEEHNGKIYLGSLGAQWIAEYDLSKKN